MPTIRGLIAVAFVGAVTLVTAPVSAMPSAVALRCEPIAPLYAGGSGITRATVRDSTLLALFSSGQTFPEFLEAARARRAGWLEINAGVRVDEAMVARATALGGSWRLLVVAIDSCGDSMQQVPFAAALAERVPGLELRIVPPSAGKAVQQAHRSLDGRTATPTFVLLDADGRDAGCAVEFPKPLREWNFARLDSMSSADRHAYMREWYQRDHGESVVRGLVELMEAAQAGTPVCDSPTGPSEQG